MRQRRPAAGAGPILNELEFKQAALCPAPWGVFADAHGNPFGMAAILSALRAAGARSLFFLGDAVGYLPLEEEVLDMLQEVGAIAVMGNHDAMLLDCVPLDAAKDSVYGLAAARNRIFSGRRPELSRRPLRLVLGGAVERSAVLMVHGTPSDPLGGYVYAETPLAGMDALGYGAIFLAQTHRPFIRRIGATLVVNVGSCGLPRDMGNLAAGVIYDPATDRAEILRVPFDVEALMKEAERIGPVAPAVKECLARRTAIVAETGEASRQ
jgi:predicted phosphodiesterase